MFKLQNKVEIIVPKEDNNGKHIMNNQLNESHKTITRICGGCTITDVKGQWWSDDEQRIMQDNNTNYEWYYDKDMQDINDQQGLLQSLSTITRILITEYNQEAVSIKVNGTLYIIDESDLNFLSYELYGLMF
ncbi:hypothetical protein [Staphylococcus phage phiIPLA-RODI]|uniref:Uncharacterized protein n=1 Tax=Staphylococcus phage phiIPLA-RODI TaxID=1572703 RepID=A0A0D3MWB5_9CAUD|nr:hypothetical protein AVU41_gp210 [Staphylococcus phage phiIPLA-RODI]AJA42172.1 hypothetical protein [Staphylococcus phage phiIPLA-RODI]